MNEINKPEGVPLPWLCQNGHTVQIKDANGNDVTEVFSEFPGTADRDIAAYIVNCVNQHQTLLERLSTKIEEDKWYPFPEHKPAVGERFWVMRGEALYIADREADGFVVGVTKYYDHNENDVTHFMRYKLPRRPNKENTVGKNSR